MQKRFWTVQLNILMDIVRKECKDCGQEFLSPSEYKRHQQTISIAGTVIVNYSYTS
jgi:hypothetical protein